MPAWDADGNSSSGTIRSTTAVTRVQSRSRQFPVDLRVVSAEGGVRRREARWQRRPIVAQSGASVATLRDRAPQHGGAGLRVLHGLVLQPEETLIASSVERLSDRRPIDCSGAWLVSAGAVGDLDMANNGCRLLDCPN